MSKARRRAALIALLMVCAVAAVPAFSATSPGSITLRTPKSSDKVRLQTPVEWAWRSGTYVSRSSQVDVLVTRNGLQWTTVASRVPIRNGETTWDTTKHSDGFYMMRVVVRGTTIRSTSGLFYLDNTAPVVRIDRPSEGDVIVEDDEKASFAVVAGSATLVADARDAFTGIETVTWLLDEIEIGKGISYTHNFNDATPGKHDLTAVATDKAGNTSLPYSIEILTLRGPSSVGDPSVEEPTLPGEDTVPNPDDLPGEDTVPGDTIPDEETLPGEDDVPNPDDISPPVDPSASPSPLTIPSIPPEGIPPEL